MTNHPCLLHRVPTHCLLVCLAATLSSQGEILPPGHRPVPPGVHALVGAKVVVKPGETLDAATIIIRDGLIEAVGTNVTAPPDARVWELNGMIVYAGFIDPYLTLGASTTPATEAPRPPEDELTAGGINFFGVAGAERDPGTRGPGSGISRITPEKRVATTLSPDEKALAQMRELGFTAGNVVPERGILRGSSALLALSDVNPNQAIISPDVFQHVAFETAGRGEGYPGSLMGVIAAVRQEFFNAQHYALDHAGYAERRDARKPPPFNPAHDALKPAMEKRMRVVFEPESALMVDRAVKVASELNLDFALVSCGQEWRRPELARATGATFIVPVNFPSIPKLPEDDDWADVTLDELRGWDWAPENPALLRQQSLEIALTTFELSDKKAFRKNLRLALDRGLSEDDALAALTTVPARLCGVEKLLGTVEAGKLAHLTVVEGKGYFDPTAKVRAVWIDGRHYHVELPGTDAAKEPEKETPEENPEKKEDEKKELQKKRVARAPLEGRGPLASPASVLVTNATIWTCGPQGILSNASLLISNGKIQNVGRFKAELSADTLVIDAAGKHLTPGLLDCHSHTAILGGVNEGTIPSSAMVRIGDVVNSETETLYQQLAGGLTTANLLHGSANPIGGQNAVIKLRDGALPEELIFDAAPPGIKFALGENVKQSNANNATTRFPQTRMGVGTFYGNRFTAARQYLEDWETYRQKGGVPPRRDLELEALGEIIQGKRWVHCHSYRQDEILAFLRRMESFGVKVGTLQHILEGYKVADEIAKHGAGASCFSDWWAYKFEVYDAIPHAGSLMRDRGVTVSFNSDSSELARRMYLEAAKAVKYGGVPEVEALNFVTINPAKQLRIDHRAGSLEKGKDADFALWSKSPLDSGTVCQQTWIDGQKYFDIEADAARTAAKKQERDALIEKAKKLQGPAAKPDKKEDETARAAFFRHALETARGMGVVECMDCELHE